MQRTTPGNTLLLLHKECHGLSFTLVHLVLLAVLCTLAQLCLRQRLRSKYVTVIIIIIIIISGLGSCGSGGAWHNIRDSLCNFNVLYTDCQHQ